MTETPFNSMVSEDNDTAAWRGRLLLFEIVLNDSKAIAYERPRTNALLYPNRLVTTSAIPTTIALSFPHSAVIPLSKPQLSLEPLAFNMDKRINRHPHHSTRKLHKR